MRGSLEQAVRHVLSVLQEKATNIITQTINDLKDFQHSRQIDKELVQCAKKEHTRVSISGQICLMNFFSWK